MLFNKAVVHGVARIKVSIVHGAAMLGSSMVELALEPHGVDPLQKPRARHRMRGARNPIVRDMVLLGIRTDGLIQIDPSLPHIGGVVHVVHATDHVTLGLRDAKLARVLRNTVAGAILLVVVVLGLIGKAIPLPVVHTIFILELVDTLSVPLEISTIGHVN